MHYPQIDYINHPAYGPYKSKLIYDDVLVHGLVNEFDRIHEQFCALQNPSDESAFDALSELRDRMEHMRRHAREQGISIIAEEWLCATSEWVIGALAHEYARRVISVQHYIPKVLSVEKHRQLLSMCDQGMYITELPADSYADICQFALEHRTELRRRALSNRSERSVYTVPFNSPLWRALKRASADAGIFDVLGEFKKSKMTLLGAGLEYSCPEQKWSQNLYADVGLADGPMRYLHVDEDDYLPKAMIYVTPVGLHNGATRMIPQSNRWSRSQLLFNMHKGLDHVVGIRYEKYSRTGSYRLLARTPELRRIFMQLPKAFQGSSHFGDDVLEGTELAKTLASLEVPYLSEHGQACVFDGGRTLHRGSLVELDERIAIQVVFRSQNEEKIKSHLKRETFLKEQFALGKKYLRKFAKKYV